MIIKNEIEALFEPLFSIKHKCCYVRMIVYSDHVIIDATDNKHKLYDIDWDETKHAQALKILDELYVFENGYTAKALSDIIIIQCALNPSKNIENLIEDEKISHLAGRLLTQSLTLKRNILFLGHFEFCVEMITALLNDADRPAIIGGIEDAISPSWQRFSTYKDAFLYGADRIGAWSLSTKNLTELMSLGSGVVAFMDTTRIDKALMRFENSYHPDINQDGALKVLSSIDIIVKNSFKKNTVDEITEIILTDEGYRPKTLFKDDQNQLQSALVPIALPSFINDLDRIDSHVLANELRSAVHQDSKSHIIQTEKPILYRKSSHIKPSLTHEKNIDSHEKTSLLLDKNINESLSPGWELDQETEIELSNPQENISQDDSLMETTYGLAPPKAPKNSKNKTNTLFENKFQEALKQAKNLKKRINKKSL